MRGKPSATERRSLQSETAAKIGVFSPELFRQRFTKTLVFLFELEKFGEIVCQRRCGRCWLRSTVWPAFACRWACCCCALAAGRCGAGNCWRCGNFGALGTTTTVFLDRLGRRCSCLRIRLFGTRCAFLLCRGFWRYGGCVWSDAWIVVVGHWRVSLFGNFVVVCRFEAVNIACDTSAFEHNAQCNLQLS